MGSAAYRTAKFGTESMDYIDREEGDHGTG
jgi:hypothetical protein